MDLLFFTNFLNAFFMVALPVGLGIVLVHKTRLGWKIWLIGAATFIFSQLLHIPFNSFILIPALGNPQVISGNPVQAFALGLSAGVFEECARYGMFRWLLKDRQTWRSAILAGAGHGGAEAIYFGINLLWFFINMAAVRHADLGTLNLAPDQLPLIQQQVQAYWSNPWYNTLLPVVERAFTIPFHIMASVLVLQVFTRSPKRQQLGWLGLAILLHAMLDAFALIIASLWSVYAAEAVLGGLAIIDIFIIIALRQPETEPVGPNQSGINKEPPVFLPKPIDETSENLEKTRYA